MRDSVGTTEAAARVSGPESAPTGAGAAAAPRLAIVMPAYQAAHLLPQTLPPLVANPLGAEVLVVDPGSTDGTADVAERLGARVLRLGRRAGPAEARNAGTELVDADVVLFVDSDCVAHADTVERVHRAFADDPQLVTLTGSYDDTPPDPGFFSQYMNLRHHATHQHARRENATFWAGCGAVRRDAFLQVGGFDAALYPRPMIEDIELGMRMAPLGRTCLDPALHVTHLKRWTLRSTVHTDVFCRAVPWSRLLRERGGMPNDLNLRTSQRVAALLAPLALLACVALPALLVLGSVWALVPAALIAASLALNADLVLSFLRRRGLGFALGGWLFHQVHLFYSAVTFVVVALAVALGPRRTAAR